MYNVMSNYEQIHQRTKGDSLGDNLCIRLRSYLSEIFWDKNNKDRREAGIAFNKFINLSILLLYIALKL